MDGFNMEQKSTSELLQEIRERNQRMAEQDEADQIEALRFRTLTEAKALIDYWKKQYRRKKKVMTISIAAQYFPSPVGKTFYKLRIFYDRELQQMYNIEDYAALELIRGIAEDSLPGISYYTLHSQNS